MRIIVGYGNDLRGEDSFGVDVVKQLGKHLLRDTKLLSCFQLTPELALDLLEAEEIIFVDAAYSSSSHYAIACNLEAEAASNLSHHIGFKTILAILKELYGKSPKYEVFSLLTDSFDEIKEKGLYKKRIDQTVDFILRSQV